MTIRIRNWSKHQHFKDRTPPWIKLYRDILDDPDWHAMSGDDAKLLVGLWLVASEDESRTGTLPECRRLAFRLRISEAQLNQGLNRLSHWLERDDNAVISHCYQDDAPETETETEAEGETEEDEPAIAGLPPASPEDTQPAGDASGERPQKGRPPCPHERIIAAYHETLPELRQVRVWNETRRRLLCRRWSESPERQSVGWWREFFGYVRKSRFLMGQTAGRDGRPFDCDLEWLVRPTNFAKVLEGKYE